MSGFSGQFNSRYHIAVGRDDNCKVTVILIRVRNYLSRDAYICFFFLMGMDLVPAIKAGDLFF